MKWPARTLALLVVLASAAPEAFACHTPQIPGLNRSGLNYARLVISSDAASMVAGGAQAILSGGEKWNDTTCNSEANWVRPFPLFFDSQGPAIQVVRETGLSGQFANRDTCASINVPSNVDTAILRLYSSIRGPGNVIYSCNWDDPERVALVVAHELGHYLGLDESGCAGSIMGAWHHQFDSSSGKATSVAAGHAIRDYECEKADEISLSPSEDAWEEQQCGLDPNCDPYAPCWSSPGCTCPIVLDLDRDQFHFAGLDETVSFDIDADGVDEQITWTQVGSLDSFLCWDRNGDGEINDGMELFGNSTVLMDGTRSPYGYIALAELDELAAGGNADGLIDSQDSAYTSLCLWTDLDHDGETDSNELQSLAEAGVLAMEVESRSYPRRDSAGNLLLYTASAWIESTNGNGVKKIATTDVFFVEDEAGN